MFSQVVFPPIRCSLRPVHPVLLLLLSGPLVSTSIEIWKEQTCPALFVLYVLVVTLTRNWIEAWFETAGIGGLSVNSFRVNRKQKCGEVQQGCFSEKFE